MRHESTNAHSQTDSDVLQDRKTPPKMSDPSLGPGYDVVVIGAGHAGCEAGLASARIGASTLVITPNLDRTGYMPCNPSIGGPGKSHLVAEVDALGGAMAQVADQTRLNVRLLNTSKGPAVQALRSQQDKSLYAMVMKATLESQENLTLIQDEVVALRLESGPDGRPAVAAVQCRQRGLIHCRAAIVTAGTFLRGAMVAGEVRDAGGRTGDRSDTALAGTMADLGFQLRRLKTGTPPRIDGRTIDFDECEEQHGDAGDRWLSQAGVLGQIQGIRLPRHPLHPESQSLSTEGQLSCFRTQTGPQTHQIIERNLHRAPMFNGGIDGVGPRYCPSIEDKVGRFRDKSSHTVFLEPEGWQTSEYYVQGMSTSLPFDVQDDVVHSIPGLTRSVITRYGYAVEYDAIDPSELTSTMESRRVGRLFLAGQVNGTSGYEEAAGQGLLAGWNAANASRNNEYVRLTRDQAYIGVMVDDLVSKPFEEPYRMFTSRAEYRLLLRPETANDRLAHLAFDHGLIDAARMEQVGNDRGLLDAALTELSVHRIHPESSAERLLVEHGFGPLSKPHSLLELFRRPGNGPSEMKLVGEILDVRTLKALPHHLRPRLDQEIKYGGFVEREAKEVARHSALERRKIPDSLDFAEISGLRIEARMKLAQHQPRTFGEAGRLSGVTPADIAVLLVHATRTSQSLV